MRKLIAAVVLLGSSAIAWAGDEGARGVVAKLDNTLLDVMKKANELGYEGRKDVLGPVVLETHDFESISKLAVGKHWKMLSEQERAALVKKLTEYSIATYAAQFDNYTGEEFTYESQEDVKAHRVVVHYTLKVPGEADRKFDYIMNQEPDGRWRIINIVVDGISDLALKRAQYESIIEKDGFPKLLDKLSELIDNYAKTRSGGGTS